MQKITRFLWFNDNAEEAIEFYTFVFKDASLKNLVRYTSAVPGPEGSVMTAVLELNGQELILLNGGPLFQFNESVSFVINCKTQEEINHYWEKLSEGGKKDRCGWLKDKFGLSWQVVPTVLTEFLSSGDTERTDRVMRAMLKMDKLDINDLQKAYKDN